MLFRYGNAAPNASANRSGRSRSEVLALNKISELSTEPDGAIESKSFVS
jgi:hypothetical protein